MLAIKIQLVHRIQVGQMQAPVAGAAIMEAFQETAVVSVGVEIVDILMDLLTRIHREILLPKLYQIVKAQVQQKECQKEKQRRLVLQKRLH